MSPTRAPGVPQSAGSLFRQSRRLLRFVPTIGLVDLWLEGLAAGPEAGIPGFDPIDAPALLGFVYILERDGDHLRYRVSGESVNQLFGSNHAGKRLDEVVPRGVHSLVEPYFLDVLDRKACIMKGQVRLTGHRTAEFERVLLPVHRAGRTQILGAVALSNTATLRAEDPVPPPADPGFHFTQIDLSTGAVAEKSVPLSEIPVEQLPFEDHVRRRSRAMNVSRAVAQKDFETEC